jgi:hypothetical protein
MAWREVLDRRTGCLIGIAFDGHSQPSHTAPVCRFSSGVEFEAELKIIEHPEGRFIREDGTRIDVLVMDLLADAEIIPPSITPRDPANSQRESIETRVGARFLGERRDQVNGGSCVRINNTKVA